jgi:hypothetical protein
MCMCLACLTLTCLFYVHIYYKIVILMILVRKGVWYLTLLSSYALATASDLGLNGELHYLGCQHPHFIDTRNE